jgi:hypothetical protein
METASTSPAHTAGPWHVTANSGSMLTVMSNDANTVAAIGYEDEGSNLANARLISFLNSHIMNSTHIWYSLNVADIQDVADTNLDRELTDDELQKVIATAEQHIPYADTIWNAIAANGIQ